MPPGLSSTSRLAGVLIALSIATSLAGGQGASLIVERRSAPRVSVDAGGRVTVIFRVLNRRSAAQRVRSRFDLLPEWRVVTPDSTITTLQAGEAALKFLVVMVPASARAGEYTLRYEVSRDDPSATTAPVQDSVVLSVAERRRLQATSLSTPRFVAAGDPYVAKFTVANIGNAAALVRLMVTSSDGLKARLDTSMIQLAPGDGHVISVAVQTNDGVARKILHHLVLTAMVAKDTGAHASATSRVEIIPVRASASSRFRGVPARLTVIESGTGQTPTAELRGAGFVTPTGATRMDFLLRGPRVNNLAFGGQDEYWLNLQSPKRYQLRLGDQGYYGSRLSSTGRPEFGASGELVTAGGALALSADAQQDRRTWDFTHEQEYGGGAEYRAGNTRFNTRYVRRSGIDSASVWTTGGFLAPLPTMTLQWEYGRGSAGGITGNAYALTVAGTQLHGNLIYAFTRDAADQEFPGVWRGTQNSSGTASVRLFRDLSLFGEATGSSRPQATLFSSIGVLPASTTGGVDGGIAVGNFIAGYRRVHEAGSTLPSFAARSSNSVHVQSALSLRTIQLSGHLESGYTSYDASILPTVPFARGTGSVSLSMGQQRVALALTRFTGTPIYSLSPQNQNSASLFGLFHLTVGTAINAGVNAVRQGGLHPQTFSLFDIGVTQQLGYGHQTKWQGRSISAGGPRNMMQQTEYSVPVNLPIAVSDEGGVVEAHLTDAASAKPVAGILMRLGGEARFTDKDGRARFTGFPPGTYYLDVDREKLGSARVITPVTPISVTLSGRSIQRIELKVTGSVRVTGTARLMVFAPNRPLGARDSLIDAGALTGLVLSLVDGDTLRAEADAWGRFSFDDLHEGRWTLRVIGGLPANYRLDTLQVNLEMKAGEVRDVVFRALPTRPAAKFQPTEEVPVVVAATPTATAPALPPLPRADKNWRAPVVHHYYTISPKDAGLMMIARYMYNDGTLWPKIWLANLDQVPDPGAIHSGIHLRIPDKAPLTAAEIAARDAYARRRR
jgi:hypothetical protein